MVLRFEVLNLVISGIPSIPITKGQKDGYLLDSFKPCYKWNTFNTKSVKNSKEIETLRSF